MRQLKRNLPEKFVPIGRVEKAVGIRGELIVSIDRESTRSPSTLSWIFIGPPEHPCPAPFKVLWIRMIDERRGIYRMALKYVSTRKDAEELNGMTIYVEPSRYKTPPFSRHIGKTVIDASRGTIIGRISSIEKYPQGLIFVVSLEQDGKEIMIPEQLILSFREECVLARVPSGLIEGQI